MCFGMVFLPFHRFVEILESHWLISLTSLLKFPTTVFFQILLLSHSLFLFHYGFNYMYIKCFTMPLSFFLCIFLFCLFSNLLLLFSSAGLIGYYNKSIKFFISISHTIFFLHRPVLSGHLIYFHKHINNNYFMSMSHYSNVWIMCGSISIANFLDHSVLLL